MNLLNREGWLVTFVILSSIYAQAFADVCDDCEGRQCHHGCTINEAGHCRCICNKGYELALNQQNCTDVNECDALNGMCSHNCSNTEGSFNCFCPMGMKLNKDKTTCSGCPDGTYGVNCANNCACGVGSLTCDSKVGCVCKTGWEGDKCDIDINECNNASMRSECQNKLANCSNFQGGYTCRCPEGYKQNENKTCQDINECALVTTNNCTQHCENTAGSYRCSCNLTGYVLDKDNATCIETTRLIFDVKIDIKEQVDLSNRTLYNMLCEEARTTLLTEFYKSGSGIIDIEILNISLGSLIIKTAAVVPKETQQQSASSLSAFFINVAGSNLTIGSYSGLTSIVVNGMQVTYNSGLCDVYSKFSMCGDSQECVISSGQSMCRNIQSEADNSLILTVSLSIAIPLGIISVVLLTFVYIRYLPEKFDEENCKSFHCKGLCVCINCNRCSEDQRNMRKFDDVLGYEQSPARIPVKKRQRLHTNLGTIEEDKGNNSSFI